MKRDILVKWFFPHPPEDVWECLTNADLIGQWLMPNDFKAVPGHKFRFHSKPRVKMGWDGIVYCEVTEVVPMKRLCYTWKGGPRPGVYNLDTLLVWTLTPKDNGTELVLEHKGFEGWKNFIASLIMEKGWKNKIAKRFEEIVKQITHGTN